MPTREPSNLDILKAVQALSKTVDTHTVDLKEIKTDLRGAKKDIRDLSSLKGGVAGLKAEFQNVKEELHEVKKDLRGVKEDLQDVKETVEFIKETVATKDELEVLSLQTGAYFSKLRTDLRGEIRTTRDEMIDHVDSFIGLHRKQDVEHLALVSRLDRHEQRPHPLS